MSCTFGGSRDLKILTSAILANEFLKIYQNGGQIEAQSLASEHINAEMDATRDCVRESLNKQELLLKDIQETYESIFGKKKSDASVLTTLLMAAEAFDQLVHDVDQGITFYADLTGILVKFQNKVNDFAFARQTEKNELMKDISKELSSVKSGEAPERPPPTYLSSQQLPRTTASASDSASSAPSTAPSAPMAPPSNPNPPPMYYGPPPPGYWPGYGFPSQGMPQMPMYGAYGGYPMPMYPMPGLPSQPQQPHQ